jgi:hypothetical protein
VLFMTPRGLAFLPSDSTGGDAEPLPNAAAAGLLALLYANQAARRPVAAATRSKLECWALGQVGARAGSGSAPCARARWAGPGSGGGPAPCRPLCERVDLPSSNRPPSPLPPHRPPKVSYMLGGRVGLNRGYVVGVGSRFPRAPQHRQASCWPDRKQARGGGGGGGAEGRHLRVLCPDLHSCLAR